MIDAKRFHARERQSAIIFIRETAPKSLRHIIFFYFIFATPPSCHDDTHYDITMPLRQLFSSMPWCRWYWFGCRRFSFQTLPGIIRSLLLILIFSIADVFHCHYERHDIFTYDYQSIIDTIRRWDDDAAAGCRHCRERCHDIFTRMPCWDIFITPLRHYAEKYIFFHDTLLRLRWWEIFEDDDYTARCRVFFMVPPLIFSLRRHYYLYIIRGYAIILCFSLLRRFYLYERYRHTCYLIAMMLSMKAIMLYA